jgi:hypothetical protein
MSNVYTSLHVSFFLLYELGDNVVTDTITESKESFVLLKSRDS